MVEFTTNGATFDNHAPQKHILAFGHDWTIRLPIA